MSGLPLNITDNAKARMMALVNGKDEAKGLVLRIAKGKGCGGNEYRMDYATDVDGAFDKVELSDGAALYVPLEDSFHMFGMEIDFITDELDNSQFTFTNPNEAGRCGCGLSFSLENDIKKQDINPEDVDCYREF